ncbi:exosortase A [Desulfohalovibrio reitneri]|uniref:exosortase A n=1 Tax=Desulfohalovibrio reitneri TaxID=1307759 RepID=UPI0004A6BBC2|nr:exosortase A [Desulfohalovibrio reitneri]
MTLTTALRRTWPGWVAFFAVLSLVYFPVVQGMVEDWATDENYSHGFLVPLIAGYLVYRKRDELNQTPVGTAPIGLAVVAGGVGMLVLGWLASEYFTMRSSLVVVLAGASLFLLGRRVTGKLAAPLAYLLLMVPIPYVLYNAAAFPLKLFVTEISVFTLKTMGVVVWQEGNILMFPHITLEVANACSGLRSIMSLLAIGVAYALIFHRSNIQRALLILSTIPLAVITNALRVVGTGILAKYFGEAAAKGFFHEFAGLFVFMTAVALFVALGVVLKRIGI